MKANAGDKIKFELKDEIIEGVLMPELDKNAYVIKLSSGYNISVKKADVKKEELLKPKKEVKESFLKTKLDPKLHNITILHTGGTIASKVDYETGAVVSRTSPEEILASVPELKKIANIDAKTIFQMFSEDFEPVHWSILAEKVAEEIKKKPKGIIIAMGTDTIEYAASALSFALKNLSVPVLVVGSQRSSDRPSSDASMNLICAAQFITNSDFAGVAVCMHNSENDKDCLIIESHHVKKMHTSRRDTFRPINKRPLAKVNVQGDVTFLRSDYTHDYTQTKEGFVLAQKFSERAGLIKIYPGFQASQLDWYEKNCDGLVIEGYAFGQLPINQTDKHTKNHPELLEKIKKIAKKMPVLIVSQRPYGLTNMNVYSTSRLLLSAGAIEGRVQSHVGLVKMSWVLANSKNPKSDLSKNICGEISDRIEDDAFLN